jgi:hypothetical protein
MAGLVGACLPLWHLSRLRQLMMSTAHVSSFRSMEHIRFNFQRFQLLMALNIHIVVFWVMPPRSREQTGPVSNSCDLYSEGALFESRPGYRLSGLRFRRDITQSLLENSGRVYLIMPRPLPSTSFPIHFGLHFLLCRSSEKN